MKHIKSFKIFEGVIKPYDFDPAIEELKSLPEITKEELERVLAPMNVEFVDVDYFKSKLQTKKEIELVPENMPPMLGGIRFAAHNVYTDKMYVCVLWNQFLNAVNDKGGKDRLFAFLREVLRHESIHQQQANKRPHIKIRNLENSPNVPDKYFGSTDETMAYAQSFVDQCHQKGMSNEDIVEHLRGAKQPVSWIENIYKRMTPDVLKRFKKYVYQYVTDEEDTEI